jgi:hypothetical protein
MGPRYFGVGLVLVHITLALCSWSGMFGIDPRPSCISVVLVDSTLVVVISIVIQYFATGVVSFGFGFRLAWRERDNVFG